MRWCLVWFSFFYASISFRLRLHFLFFLGSRFLVSSFFPLSFLISPSARPEQSTRLFVVIQQTQHLWPPPATTTTKFLKVVPGLHFNCFSFYISEPGMFLHRKKERWCLSSFIFVLFCL